MSVFLKIQDVLTGARQNGHAIANGKNIQTLKKAKIEIENILFFLNEKRSKKQGII